jgi:hypothetical protein
VKNEPSGFFTDNDTQCVAHTKTKKYPEIAYMKKLTKQQQIVRHVLRLHLRAAGLLRAAESAASAGYQADVRGAIVFVCLFCLHGHVLAE